MSQPLLSQAPQGINFQAIARDASGIPISGSGITVAFEITDAGTALVYEETHSATTDAFGLFKVIVGQGTPVSGIFSNIDWGSGQHSAQVFINGNPMGICTFESVPYALYAENGSVWAENASGTYYNSGRVGIGTSTPKTTFHLNDNGVFFGDTTSLLVGGDLTGSGSKIIWYGNKGAFRAGILSNPFGGYNYNKFWDYDSIGYYSFAAGYNSRAKGFGSFAFGSFGWSDGSNSVAFFGNAKGNNSFTFGGSSKGRGSITFEGVADEEGGIAMYGYTGGRYGVSIGGGTTGLGASSSREDYAIAIGWNSDARGQASIALGPSDAYGYNAFSTGWVTEARGNYSSTFGYQTNSYPYASMALGRFNVITGDSAAWNNTDPIFMIGDGSSNSNRSNSFMIQKNGQTAIGYNAPTGMLQVSSALGSLNNGGLDVTHATLLLGTTTSGIAFDANQMESIGSRLYLNYNSNQEISLGFGGGNVGIGVDNPNAKLHIKQITNLAGGGIRLVSSASANYWDLFYDGAADLRFARNGISKASIDQVNGAYNQLSDARFKTNIMALTPVLDRVMQLQAKSYHYTDNTEDDDPSLGFLAQEVEEIFPEIVNNKEGIRSLSYGEFSVLAIKAIQEQQAQLDRQQQEIDWLKEELTQLKKHKRFKK
ncbi:MAG: tail fiber domain-containing protein [Bacteroidota bacterium]